MARKNVDYVAVLLRSLTTADTKGVEALRQLWKAIQVPRRVPPARACRFRLQTLNGTWKHYKGKLTESHCKLVQKAVSSGDYNMVTKTLGELLASVDAAVADHVVPELLSALGLPHYFNPDIGACYYDTNQCQNLSNSQCTQLNPTRTWVGGSSCTQH
jgi:hypothetical protein